MNNDECEVDVRDVEYQQQAGKAWLARIYQPKGTGPFPTIVDVHGGAWHNGDRTNNAGIDQALAAKGYHYQFIFARSAVHCDRAVKQQTLPEALEYVWQGYPTATPQ